MIRRSALRTALLTIWVLSLLGCVGSPTTLGPERIHLKMAHQVEDKKLSLDTSTDIFTTDIPFAYAWAQFDNLAGQHTLQWRWVDPDGSVYLQKAVSSPIGEDRVQRSYVRSSHRIKIAGEAAATMPGQWTIQVLLDGRQVAEQSFEIRVGDSDVDRIPNLRPRPNANAYAVIIGVESYQDSQITSVDFAQRDAEIMKKYLINAMGYREENIKTLINEGATFKRIETALEVWLANHVDEESEVFVFYAGHGTSVHNPERNQAEAYLVPYDGERTDLKRIAYPTRRLYQTLDALPSKQVVVALDSCFSGGGRSITKPGRRPAVVTYPSLLDTENLIVFSAAQGDQISSAFPEKGHGIFTYFFLKGLQGAADQWGNKDGVVNIEEVFTYVKSRVARQARRIDEKQTPVLRPSLALLNERASIPLVDLRRYRQP